MSFIERAVEQLQQEKTATPSLESRSPRVATRVEPSIEPPPPAAGELDATGHRLPHRSDRRVTVDRMRLRAAGVIAPESEERRLGEEYRLIKRPLLSILARDDAPALSNVIVITSAVPGEGKTFTSVNLALSLALERNREVVLVDGDVAKRDITRLFGLNDQPGLLDAAGSEDRELAETVLRSDVPSLYVLPAGNQHSEATEILASERMAAMLNSLAAAPRRIVVVDSPPLLVTSEAGVLASLAGQVVVVVKASETPQEIVLRAIETLPEDKSVSLVLNQVLSVPERSYGHYGYYGDYARSGHDRDLSNTTDSTSRSPD
jgi:exopolysaccharide/PEP-CTERM locus tyrosine autokinase